MQNVRDQRSPTDGVTLGLTEQELCLEADEVRLVVVEVDRQIEGVVRAGKGVRVFAVG